MGPPQRTPREVGRRTDRVTQDVSGTDLDRPAVVTCATERVEPTVVGLWKLRLALEPVDGSSGGAVEQLTIWVEPDGTVVRQLVEYDVGRGG